MRGRSGLITSMQALLHALGSRRKQGVALHGVKILQEVPTPMAMFYVPPG